ncbi:MAG: RNA polymerase sigma-70 factor ECF subfamily [Elusimicrobia bacterium]|nr:MAG: RNA polymerase sigma-70 factor ECF subfamily [Elusimicrobiota bacterium]KAF0154582.1 MAG: RNA polymerase sigma-70 factor ECF subfamily [Elusimicrobiota bacterium]
MDFADIYDRYFDKVYNYVRYRVRLIDAADDITAKVFEAALGRSAAYDPAKGPEQAWLFGIARNAVADWGRDRGRRAEVPLDGVFERPGGDPRAEDILEGREERERVLAAAAALDERSRDIMALKFSSGMTNREIAALTGLAEGNVGIIIYRAVKRMQELLGGSKAI